MKVVLSHDWINGMRGGEKCLEIISSILPVKCIYTLFYKKGSVTEGIEKHKIISSFLQNIPFSGRFYKHLLPFYPLAIESFEAEECDLVISTSHCVAKGITVPKGAKHLCYCFTPMRYAWLFFNDYFGSYPKPVQFLIKKIISRLKVWDVRRNASVDQFIGISHHVKRRIEKFYNREASVIYPPVDTDFYTCSDAKRGDYYLIVSALVPYKRVDLAVRAFNSIREKLVIIGKGPESEGLKKIAGPNIEFWGWRENTEIRDAYRRAKALIFPGEEDFGIVPLEANACGTPVIAYAKGGLLETLNEGSTGLFFKESTSECLAQAVVRSREIVWDHCAIRSHAEKFSNDRFAREIHEAALKLVEGKK